jgi:hypothetical protein
VRRLHWSIAGWVLGLTLIVIDGTTVLDGR